MVLVLGLHGWSMLHARRILGAHVSEPQPLNWENLSSSCRGDFGHSHGMAGRRGRTHSQCLVLDWCWLSCGISDNVLGFCTDTLTPGGAQARAEGNNGMVDSVWCRNLYSSAFRKGGE